MLVNKPKKSYELSQEKIAEFNAIVKHMMPKIKYRTKYFYPNSKQDREELLQNTLLKAYLYFNNYNPLQGSFMGWISYIMKSEMIDDYRKNNKKKNLTETLDKEDENGYTPSSYISGNDFERIEKKIELEEVYKNKISLLSELQVKILNMVIEGYSIREISDNFDMTEIAIKTRICRIRSIIR